MNRNLIALTVLAILAFVQTASSLQCYTCSTVSSCAKPSKIDCTVVAANSTRSLLRQYYLNVSNVTSANYDCQYVKLRTLQKTDVAFSGCIFREVGACRLSINSAIVNATAPRQSACCSGNLCNKSPAAQVSINTFTVFGALLAVIVAKFLVI